MPFQIIRNDITKVKADAIVNTANPEPIYASGTDGAIYKAAGANELLAERKKIGAIAPGEVAVTPAFALDAKYIIHTVGPAWEDGKHGEFDILKSCYGKSLVKASELGCESIAFPLIATGVYGFPKAEALRVAMDEISAFLMQDEGDMVVKLVVFDDRAFRLSRNLFFQVESFVEDEDVLAAHREEYGIDPSEHEISILYNRRLTDRRRALFHLDSTEAPPVKIPFDESTFDKEKYMHDEKEDCAFQQQLLKFLIEKGLDNAIVYKRANIDRKAFSKIICGDTKKPQKQTVLGLCIAMELSLEEAKELLASADMGFNPHNNRDQLLIDCILREQYDVKEINEMLFVCGQPLLGNLD